MTVLVTGGAGFIGSHTCVELLAAGQSVVVLDNFSNSSSASLERVQRLASKSLVIETGDVRDRACLERLFASHRVACVVHFAGLKAVGESVAKPLDYYDNNVAGTLQLLRVMSAFSVRRFVFSSSATVYGATETMPLYETSALSAANPYGRSKLHIEQMLADLAVSDPRWKIAMLRYFNPVGAHASGEIGEDPRGIPNNLMPYLMQVAIGRLSHVRVFGNDYPTKDGTGVRDYIHVVDLARGHVAAVQRLEQLDGARAINLGTGCGYSVLELIAAVSKAVGRSLPYEFAPRRAGDVAASVSCPNLAKELLGWSAERGLAEMCADSWRWQFKNPDGYDA